MKSGGAQTQQSKNKIQEGKISHEEGAKIIEKNLEQSQKFKLYPNHKNGERPKSMQNLETKTQNVTGNEQRTQRILNTIKELGMALTRNAKGINMVIMCTTPYRSLSTQICH